VSPWSSAETEKETMADGEAFERELFARRARALGAEAVPSLASVMRAAESNREESAVRGARGRVIMAAVLAAACMMAALTRIPRVETSGAIVAEVDAAAPASDTIVEAAPAGECTMNEEIVASEESACVAPTPLFTPARLFSARPLDPPCGADESCAITTQ
jgi:hypothetical protein